MSYGRQEKRLGLGLNFSSDYFGGSGEGWAGRLIFEVAVTSVAEVFQRFPMQLCAGLRRKFHTARVGVDEFKRPFTRANLLSFSGSTRKTLTPIFTRSALRRSRTVQTVKIIAYAAINTAATVLCRQVASRKSLGAVASWYFERRVCLKL
jgi:hypothetical protein